MYSTVCPYCMYGHTYDCSTYVVRTVVRMYSTVLSVNVELFSKQTEFSIVFQVVDILHGSSEEVLTIERLQPFHKYVILAAVQLFASNSNSSLLFSDFALVLTNSSSAYSTNTLYLNYFRKVELTF